MHFCLHPTKVMVFCYSTHLLHVDFSISDQNSTQNRQVSVTIPSTIPSTLNLSWTEMQSKPSKQFPGRDHQVLFDGKVHHVGSWSTSIQLSSAASSIAPSSLLNKTIKAMNSCFWITLKFSWCHNIKKISFPLIKLDCFNSESLTCCSTARKTFSFSEFFFRSRCRLINKKAGKRKKLFN